ncbi:hypothetical protein J3R74_003109 [Puniceicoccus vermicola]
MHPAVEERKISEADSSSVAERYSRPSAKPVPPAKPANEELTRKDAAEKSGDSGSDSREKRPRSDSSRRSSSGSRGSGSSSRSRRQGSGSKPARAPSPMIDVVSDRSLNDSVEVPGRYARRSLRDSRSARKRRTPGEFEKKDSRES